MIKMLPQCHVSSALLYCLTLHCSRNTRVNRLNNHVLTATHGHSDILIHTTQQPFTRARVEPECTATPFRFLFAKTSVKNFYITYDTRKDNKLPIKKHVFYHLQNTTGQTRHRGVIYQTACCLICCFTYLNEGIGPCLLCRCPPYSCVCTVHP